MLGILLGLIKNSLVPNAANTMFFNTQTNFKLLKTLFEQENGRKKAYTIFESRDNFVCPFNALKFII